MIAPPVLLRLAAFATIAASTACDLPLDQRGTLERVTGRELRVGVVAAEGAAEPAIAAAVREDRGLVERLARDLRATPVWTHAPAEALFLALERREIDLAVGGVYGDSPWKGRIALSKPVGPYPGEPQGDRRFGLPPGENRWLLTINRFLAGHKRGGTS